MTARQAGVEPVSVVSAQAVHVGDTVHVFGAARVVRNLRTLPGGDKLLFFEDGITYRLPATVPAPPTPAAAPSTALSWHPQPDHSPGAAPVTHAMQCTVCTKSSAAYEEFAAAQRWMVEHVGRLPAHTTFREVIRRPWRTHFHGGIQLMVHTDIDPAKPPRRRIGAVVLVRDPAGAVLLVKPTYREGWILPGGGAQEGEPVAHAAARELEEETGLVRPLTHLVTFDQVPAAEDGTSAEGFNFVLDGGLLTAEEAAAVRVPQAARAELSECAWVPLGELPDYTRPHQEARIRGAVHAIDHGNELPLLMMGEHTPGPAPDPDPAP